MEHAVHRWLARFAFARWLLSGMRHVQLLQWHPDHLRPLPMNHEPEVQSFHRQSILADNVSHPSSSDPKLPIALHYLVVEMLFVQQHIRPAYLSSVHALHGHTNVGLYLFANDPLGHESSDPNSVPSLYQL